LIHKISASKNLSRCDPALLEMSGIKGNRCRDDIQLSVDKIFKDDVGNWAPPRLSAYVFNFGGHVRYGDTASKQLSSFIPVHARGLLPMPKRNFGFEQAGL